MEVTCHPRLGGASLREAGVTGISVGRIFIIKDLFFQPLEKIVDTRSADGHLKG